MYPEFETKTSFKYLKEVIIVLKEPICILGGWAVFFYVNKEFKKRQGREYIGSRDIDLGFHLQKNMSLKDMRNSSLYKSLDVLQSKLHFRSISFRLLKEIHTETREEIRTGEYVPAHFVFPLYVDPLVDVIPKRFKEVFRFQPADEPLLRYVFTDGRYRKELKEFNKKLWLPTVDVLLATKLHALKLRDKEHKRIKDICDIFALLWYSKEIPLTLRKNIRRFISYKDVKNIIKIVTDEDYENVGMQVNHNAQEVRRVIEILSER